MTRPSRVMMPTQYVIAVVLLRVVAPAASGLVLTIVISPAVAKQAGRGAGGGSLAFDGRSRKEINRSIEPGDADAVMLVTVRPPEPGGDASEKVKCSFESVMN